MTGGSEDLRKALEDAVCDAVTGKDIAVAFSGGLDSGIIAALVKKHAREATLYTVGTRDSHDVKEAEISAEELGMSGGYLEINEDDVLEGIREILSITGMKDPVTVSFEIPLYFVCRYAEEKDILTGQGADELFAGYSKYVGLGEEDLKRMMAEDLKKVLELTVPYEKKIAEHFGKRIHHPFLDKNVIRAAGELDINELISSEDPASRKRVLREAAKTFGYAGISSKEKKAAQYGSGVMVLIKRICRMNGQTFAELIEFIRREVL
ncbi:asparagine synthetase B [Candidatus Methanoplasma termitum]|uniref:Asparagine synthetase B n=1 Tax=Candidatus Methanoplasma termitum TaxID=1577791 RepID=A0A0A7LBA7_9ARCH|nr:asparagine synthase C-terminal domain-containing protein [Candidatus Methanoplasma termitum]AIZ56293.1 asparagine synthetase B [Candidatus Methanoplasma termitum]MCL2333909.1 asparagine synthase C-terminal domain-containing protein [Candidatus Methanoplasma sp.]